MLNKILKNMEKGQSVRLNNHTCPYCGVEITNENKTKEHVIARNFVPVGSFENQWNLIVQSCEKCNNLKSDLEDDISALTLDLYMIEGILDESSREKAIRKSNSCVNRVNKKLVKESKIFSNIIYPLNDDFNIKISYKAPAQLDEFRCFELARYHLLAFFYFITFNDKTMTGFCWPGGYHPAFQSNYSDWGNITQVGFMKAVSNWELRFLGITANGFFKIIIRKHPTVACWSWAVEWNKCYRLVGFVGCRKTAEEVVKLIPELEWKIIKSDDKNCNYYREESKLKDFDDILFKI